MQAKQFVDELYKACNKAGLQEFQINYSRSQSENLEVFEQRISKQSNNEAQRLILKVKKNGKIGTYACEELEVKNIPQIIEKSVENAVLIDNEEDDFFHDGSGNYQKVKAYTPELNLLKKLDKFDFLKKAEARAYQTDKRVNKVIATAYGYGEESLIMRNSLGLDIADERRAAYAYIYLSVKDGEIIKTASQETAFEKIEDFDAEKLADEAVAKALKKLNLVDIESKKHQVMFEGQCFNDIVKMLGGLVSAKNIHENKSQWKEKIGKLVASKAVTLIDNPFIEGGFGTQAYDYEGYPSSCKEVIKDGELQTYLYGLKTAHKDGVKSTGNGSGNEIMVFNFYIKPGEKSRDDLFKEMKSGVYIDELNGIHAGYDMVSGNFSFGASGFEVKNGKIGSYLNQFTISGNIYEMMKNVVDVANDLDFDFGKIGSPSIWVGELNLSR